MASSSQECPNSKRASASSSRERRNSKRARASSSGDEDENDPNSKRARANLQQFLQSPMKDRFIEFNPLGVPTGKNAQVFQSHLTYVARMDLSCTCHHWGKIDDDTKNKYWEEVKFVFNITDDKHQQKCLVHMGELYRNWRAMLVRDYLNKNKSPCDEWKITADDWESFKAAKQTPEFKAASARGKAAAKKNLHHHRLGSGGYKSAEPKWNKTEKIYSSASSSGISWEDCPRAAAFLISRSKKDSEGRLVPASEADVTIFHQVEKVAEVKEGKFIPNRHNDVLSAALGRPEHPGRLRAYPTGYVGVKNVYGKGKRSRSSRDTCEEKVEQLTAQLARQQEIINKLMKYIPADEVDMPDAQAIRPSLPSPQVSSNHFNELQILDVQAPTSCILLVEEDGRQTAVAEGRVYPNAPGQLLHNEPLPINCYKVSLDLVLDGCDDYRVPYPVDDDPAVGRHRATFLKWPSGLVQLLDQDCTSKVHLKKKVAEKEKVASAASGIEKTPLIPDELISGLPECYHNLHDTLMMQPNGTKCYSVPMTDIFHQKVETCITLKLEHILDVYKDNRTSTEIMQIWCMYCKELLDGFTSDRFLFMDPATCACEFIKSHRGVTATYVTEFAQMVMDHQYIFLPFLQADHWILIIVHYHAKIVYYYDPANLPMGSNNCALRPFLNASARHYWQVRNTSKHAGQGEMLRYLQIFGPNQVTKKECGYYVMRAMMDICMNYATKEKSFPTRVGPNDPLSKKLYDEVKENIVDYMARAVI